MKRRTFLRTTVAAVGIGTASQTVSAADTPLEPGTWYDATVTDVTDGDTVDVQLDSDGAEYEVRVLGVDTPETRRNGRYEEVREWEGIEDDKYLTNAGEAAKDFAQTEIPEGTAVQVAVDSEEAEEDTYGRLLAYIRYDRSGDGSLNTVYNHELIRQGQARVYGSSLTQHDTYWGSEQTARANGVGVWAQSDPASTSEVGDDPVSTVFYPYVSSVATDTGTLAASRAPTFAPAGSTQSLGSGGVSYSGDIPLAGVDTANNLAMLGGLSINEAYDGQSGQHMVFLTNLLDALSAKTGDVFIDGGHHQFNQEFALSNEDAVEYQRYLEGQGIGFEQTNTYDGTVLPNARSLIVTNPEDAFTSGEVSEVSSFISNGGSVVLMGSANATSAGRSNLNRLAADLGSDLRLNDDQVFDADGNAELETDNLNTGDFSLWGAYS
jgi:endonuclease YncB( thermonuclease family)